MTKAEIYERHPDAHPFPQLLPGINHMLALYGKQLLPAGAEIYFVGQAPQTGEWRNIYALVNPAQPEAEPSYSIGYLGFAGLEPLLTWEEVGALRGD